MTTPFPTIIYFADLEIKSATNKTDVRISSVQIETQAAAAKTPSDITESGGITGTVFILLGLLFCSALFSGAEIGLYALNHVKNRYNSEKRNKISARILHWLLNPISPSVITILIANNIANQLLTQFMESGLSNVVSEEGGQSLLSVLLTTVIATPIVLLLGEFLPKSFFHTHSNRLMPYMSYPIAAARIALLPIVFLASLLTNLLQKLMGKKPRQVFEPHTSEANLRSFLRHDDAEHSLTDTQKGLIDRIMSLERVNLRYAKVSKPIDVVQRIDADKALAEIREELEAPYYTRYLVNDPRSDYPIGYVSAASLVSAADDATPRSIMNTLPHLTEHMSIAEALDILHRDGADLALIKNDQGSITDVLFRTDCLRTLIRMN